MATITTDKETIKKLDELARVLKKNALWGKRGFRSEAHRAAVAVLHHLVFEGTPVDIEKFGFMRTDSAKRPLKP